MLIKLVGDLLLASDFSKILDKFDILGEVGLILDSLIFLLYVYYL